MVVALSRLSVVIDHFNSTASFQGIVGPLIFSMSGADTGIKAAFAAYSERELPNLRKDVSDHLAQFWYTAHDSNLASWSEATAVQCEW